jgi:endonuclease/exonuclease/phosphatase family metal-dependent hydrolase
MFWFRMVAALCLVMSTQALAFLEPNVVTVPHEVAGMTKPLTNIRVMAWNIQWFPGRKPRAALPKEEEKQIRAINKILNQEKPALFFASEVRSLAHLQKLKPGSAPLSWACTQIPRTEEEGQDMYNQGLALISQVPWKRVWALDFSDLAAGYDRPYRGILGAEFPLTQNRSLYLYGVHLKSNRGNPASARMRRERAMEYLRWDWNRLGLNPKKNLILLVGDFNTSLNMSAYREEQTLRSLLDFGFIDGAEGTPSHKRMTLPASKDGRYPPADFDQMLLSPALADLMPGGKPWANVVPTPSAASDHYLMKMELPLATASSDP